MAGRDADKEERSLRSLVVSAKVAFGNLPRTLKLVLVADRPRAIVVLVLNLVGCVLPLALAYVGKFIIDGAIVAARSGAAADRSRALKYVGLELGIVFAMGLVGMVTGVVRNKVGVKLGYSIQQQIFRKALSLDLAHFEDPETYDKLQKAHREAGLRPLNLFGNAITLLGGFITLASYGTLLFAVNGWTLLALFVSTLPSFLVETRYSAQAFRLLSWQAPEQRRMRYLEWLLSNDVAAKEVRVYEIGDTVLERHESLHEKLVDLEHALVVRRTTWGFLLSNLSTLVLYACYAWFVLRTIYGRLTIGDMTLYIAVFRNGQTALRGVLRSISSAYEDNLFLSDLFAFLAIPSRERPRARPVDATPSRTGYVLEDVCFTYPGSKKPVFDKLNLVIGADEKLAIVGQNGSGKTTLIKLLLGLYEPTSGRITLDGVPLSAIAPSDLRRRCGVVLQDFMKYQFTARDNIGIGDVSAMADVARVDRAAIDGGADEVIRGLANGADTQLGRWFEGGVELSGGNWQKLAVARAFMREADILVLDEPCAALDAEAEQHLFDRFRALTDGKMAILISHRFSTVRMADRIVVLAAGKVEELGSHDDLLKANGRYAKMFRLQAAGYE